MNKKVALVVMVVLAAVMAQSAAVDEAIQLPSEGGAGCYDTPPPPPRVCPVMILPCKTDSECSPCYCVNGSCV